MNEHEKDMLVMGGAVRRLKAEIERLREGLVAAIEYLELVPDDSIDYEAALTRARAALGERASDEECNGGPYCQATEHIEGCFRSTPYRPAFDEGRDDA